MQLHHEVHGSGRPVIAVHGFAATLFTWRHLVDSISSANEFILFDLKGAGQSPRPRDGKYAPEDQVALLEEFVHEQNLSNITVIGHSMGGGISLLLAGRLLREQRERIQSLVLIGAAALPALVATLAKGLGIPLLGEGALSLMPVEFAVRTGLAFAYHDPNKITQDEIDAYGINLRAANGPYALTQMARQIFPRDIESELAAIADAGIPVLLMWGDDDRVIPLRIGEELRKRLPNSRLMLIKDCGHIPQDERPEIAVPAIAEFVANAKFPAAAS